MTASEKRKRFKAAMKAQNAASRHAFKGIGFRRQDRSEMDYKDLWLEKCHYIAKDTKRHAGTWAGQRGKR